MAFICETCHKKLHGNNGNDFHVSGSYGPCENCRNTKRCHNCYCTLKPRTRTKKVF